MEQKKKFQGWPGLLRKEKIKVFSLEVRCPKNLDLQREKGYVN